MYYHTLDFSRILQPGMKKIPFFIDFHLGTLRMIQYPSAEKENEYQNEQKLQTAVNVNK